MSNIAILDCETTGTDRAVDQIIELCIQRGLVDGEVVTWRINPTVPIHPEAQAAHGISIEQLVGCPPFADVADAIVAEIAAADVIVGYNVAFDIEMLATDLARAGRPPLDVSRKHIVDALRLWQQCEPRSLQYAHRRFVGREFDGAHSAAADVAATGRVLASMIGAFDLAGADWEAIALRADPEYGTWLGPSKHLKWERGVVVVGFGKHAGTPLHELAAGRDRSFLDWVLSKDFPPWVKQACRAALQLPAEEFLERARKRYPPPKETKTDGT